uniref:7TM_GPCR_Srx domain-containing protein n=1 Tax=Strongyloides papillosus TaxID=174720 RepID=A0A0N5B8X0_STREA
MSTIILLFSLFYCINYYRNWRLFQLCKSTIQKRLCIFFELCIIGKLFDCSINTLSASINLLFYLFFFVALYI